jgi:RF-1 domain
MGKGKPAKRELWFSVTDFKVKTFTAGGPGGQHQNHSNTAVRITHVRSGASAECREFRSQHQNIRAALEKLKNSGTFRAWLNRQMLGNPLPPEEQVERDMDPLNLLIMGKTDGKWRVID